MNTIFSLLPVIGAIAGMILGPLLYFNIGSNDYKGGKSMRVIIWFSWFRRIVKDDFQDWSFKEVEEFVSNLKSTEFIKVKDRRGHFKYLPTSEIKSVKIK